jgi:hypothetical protein
MRDPVGWLPKELDTESYGHRTVYIRHLWAPFAGWMVDANSAFTIPAFVRIKGRRVRGFVTPRDGMAFQQDHAAPWFVAYKSATST